MYIHVCDPLLEIGPIMGKTNVCFYGIGIVFLGTSYKRSPVTAYIKH